MDRYRIRRPGRYDPATAGLVEDIYHGDSLVELILHTQILIEEGVTALLRPKLPASTTMKNWTFDKKLNRYVEVCRPAKRDVEMLYRFKNLRK